MLDPLDLAGWNTVGMAEARFCDQCGKSLVPCPGPHTQRPCEVCGKTIHEAEPGEGGKGIRIQKGSKFVLPKESISISLSPKSSSQLTRAGLAWFVGHLTTEPAARNPDELDALFAYWEKEGDTVLRRSEKLAHLELDDERDQEKAVEIASQDKASVEWWAIVLVTHAQMTRDSLREGKTAEAVIAARHAQAALSMLVYARDLDEYVWTGYEHSKLIYGIATASAQDPGEAKAIEALRPKFEGLSEEVLHTWVDSDTDIGPRIGVTQVDEKLLKALARFHLNAFERQRQQEQLDREHGARMWQNRIAGAGAGVMVTTALLGALRGIGIL